MRAKLSVIASAMLLAGTLTAVGQQPGGRAPEAPPQGAEAGTQPGSQVAPMSTQQRQRIRAVILEQRVPPATVSGTLAVGATLPADVELHPVPPALVTDVPSIRNYQYVYSNDRIMLIEPSSRRIVQIID